MASKNTSMTDGQAFKALLWPLRSGALVALLCLIFWAYGIVVLSAVFIWKEPDPVWSMQELAKTELLNSAQLNTPVIDPAALSIRFGNATRENVLAMLTKGMRSLLNLPSHLPGRTIQPTDDPDPGKTFFDRWWAGNGDIVETGLWANYVVAARTLSLLCGSTPMLLLGYAIGVMDGAAARLVRRADAGRESASLYHRFKIAQLHIPALTYMLYVAWPASLKVQWVIVAMVGLCAWCVRMQLAYYKKYA